MTTITPFKLAISDRDLDDLRARLEGARWPVEVAPDSDERGIRGTTLKSLADHWLKHFDWRAQEARINACDQVMVEHEGQLMHAFHIRSSNANATPLVLIHGWPSSGAEYLKLIDHLAGDFHLVVPTLPGFGLSPAPTVAGWTMGNTAAAILALLDHLGYDRFAIHGTDMGSAVAGNLDAAAPGRAIGIHVGTDLDSVIAVASFMGADASRYPHLSDAQREQLTAAFATLPDRNGYIAIQRSRPRTLGYALNDSPLGQLAWIAEKFNAWTNPTKAGVGDAVDLNQFLVGVSLYWFGGGGAASANAMWESFRAMGWTPPSATPRGVAVFNADPLVRQLFDSEHQVPHWTEYKEGGHFPAMEEPALLATDLRQFFGSLAR
jgi:pimeloyl-ACP methyl ester carboxylesterase